MPDSNTSYDPYSPPDSAYPKPGNPLTMPTGFRLRLRHIFSDKQNFLDNVVPLLSPVLSRVEHDSLSLAVMVADHSPQKPTGR
jgi:hypothetical protein